MSIGKILPLERAYELVGELRRCGQSVVFTNGCFDLLHAGHTRLLEEARRLGNVLIVAVNSDRSVRALKGPDRPLQPEMERAEVLAALAAVDYVTIFDDPSVLGVVTRMLPDVLVKGGDYTPDEVVGHAEIEGAGGRVVQIPMVKGCSTTSLIQAARKAVACRGMSSEGGTG